MKKVLLMGAISPFCDLINEIKYLNYSAIVCDYYVDAPAKKMGYPSYNISTMDVDKLIELVEECNVNGVVSAFSDRNLIPLLEVCNRKNFNYFFSRKIIDCLTDKAAMKSYFESIGLPVIKYGIHHVDSIETELEKYDYPVVTKPIDAYGSKGIFVCRDKSDVLGVIDRVTKESLKNTDKLIIEEFYQADEISISAWVKDGKAYISCIYDVFRNFDGDFTLASVSFPSKYTEKNLQQFSKLLNKAVSGIGIEDGPVTLQCFIGDKGIKVSELLCRLAGGSPYLYPTYFGGPNIAKMVIQNAVGDEIDYQNVFDFTPYTISDEIYYDIQVMIKHKGIIHYDIDVDSVKNAISEVVDLRIYYPNESELINVGGSGVQFAKVICKTRRTSNYNEMIQRISDSISVFDENGNKVSYIRIPQRLNIFDTFDVDWSFLMKE